MADFSRTGKNQEFYFVKGVGVEWDEGPIQVDLELEFSPESPDHPEVPETGTGGYSPGCCRAPGRASPAGPGAVRQRNIAGNRFYCSTFGPD